MEITVLSAVNDKELREKDIQVAFEANLASLDNDLEFIGSEIVVGTGRIDTLAYDSENGRPVFIEYKAPGGFGREALIQLMDYLSWFGRDPNRMSLLDKIIRQRKPEIETIEPDILVICVVADIEDRIRNAIYALGSDVKVFTYLTARDTAQRLVLVPRLVADNTDVERSIPVPISEPELWNKHSDLRDLFHEIRTHVEKDGASGYATSKSFRFKKDHLFSRVRFRKKYIRLDLRVGRRAVEDPDFTNLKSGESNWGYVHLYPSNAVPDKVIAWIDLARKFVSQQTTGEDEDETPESV